MSHIRGSVGGQVPEKYYVVTNNELVRVKHLLVYSTFSGRQSRLVARITSYRVVLYYVLHVD